MSKCKVHLDVRVRLHNFYSEQGLYGKRLRKAIHRDLIYIRHNQTGVGRELAQLFLWSDTPQGTLYWAKRHGII